MIAIKRTAKIGVEFVVEGLGEFPVDMLRYDECRPKSGADWNSVSATESDELWRERRRVTLQRAEVSPHWVPTIRRWESFGWRLVEVDGVPMIESKPVKPPHLATFQLYGQHTIEVPYSRADDGSIAVILEPTCETSSLSKVMSEAAKFALRHGVNTLVIDGADLKRGR